MLQHWYRYMLGHDVFSLRRPVGGLLSRYAVLYFMISVNTIFAHLRSPSDYNSIIHFSYFILLKTVEYSFLENSKVLFNKNTGIAAAAGIRCSDIKKLLLLHHKTYCMF